MTFAKGTKFPDVAKHPQTKTYSHTQDKEFDFQLEFATSKNDKCIVVQYVSAVYKDFLDGDLCFHSNIVKRNA